MGHRYSAKEIHYALRLNPYLIIDRSLAIGDTEMGENAYIPYRNLFMAMRASSRYDPNVVIVGIKGDNVSDKTPIIFEQFGKLLSKLEGRKITVTSPFWERTKEEIIEWYLTQYPNEGHLLLETVSCYSTEFTNYCGKCKSCFRKWCALVNSGFKPSFYNMGIVHDYEQALILGKYDFERAQNIKSALEIGYADNLFGESVRC
jgi:7-cyano-7-deazaguanine synthase in queuosine biosynthesis